MSIKVRIFKRGVYFSGMKYFSECNYFRFWRLFTDWLGIMPVDKNKKHLLGLTQSNILALLISN